MKITYEKDDLIELVRKDVEAAPTRGAGYFEITLHGSYGSIEIEAEFIPGIKVDDNSPLLKVLPTSE